MSEFQDIQRGPRRARIRAATEAARADRTPGSPDLMGAAGIHPSSPPRLRRGPDLGMPQTSSPLPRATLQYGGATRGDVEFSESDDAQPMGAGALDDSGDEGVEYALEGEYDDETMGEPLDDEDMGVDHDGHDEGEDDEHHEGPTFDPVSLGLREINNLAHFGVSSHKPGNGVEELLSDDLDHYWQSDGQQPHLLTIHFMRRVEIRAIRFYVDFNQDESYTPTHVVFYAGTSHHDLIQFAEVPLKNPVGWQDVPIADCGGGRDGNSLVCWIAQMHVKENHQNGKDTHIRGIKIYAADESLSGGPVSVALDEADAKADTRSGESRSGFLQRRQGHSAKDSLDDLLGDDEIHWSSMSDFPQGPSIR
ncbi:galactose-binding like protein [Thozetella sp. PMI_491]|nr:galactose-binding like protein [Thozetella sp. PMI_491]